MPRKPTLSPTRISTYLDCALKYRFTYIEGLGRYYRRARPSLSFGATLHNVLQQFHQGGEEATLPQVQETYAERWISAGYTSAEQETEFREAGETALQTYYESMQERAEIGAVTLCVEKTLSCDMGEYRLSGRVDRIDEFPDGSLEVVDYKSGRSSVTSEEVASDLAMSIYQLLAKRNYPGRPIRATIIALRTGDYASARMSEEDATQFEQELNRIAAEILHRDFSDEVPQRKPACDRCDFLPRCAPYLDRDPYFVD
jgi:RecB family exonuclease